MMRMWRCNYGIITGTDHTVTAVISQRHILIMLEWLDWQREHIADAALSPDHARGTRIDLQFAPQPQHLDVDAPIENFVLNPRACTELSDLTSHCQGLPPRHD